MHLQFYFSSECVSPDRFIPLYDDDDDDGQWPSYCCWRYKVSLNNGQLSLFASVHMVLAWLPEWVGLRIVINLCHVRVFLWYANWPLSSAKVQTLPIKRH